ncbi:hypothetical protein [Rhodococcus sp. APC 3903]|uniref:hypothetical protein n=1 Tax=Rhodococcus sp. APC 3903 TaxID=3035193 RepID=UPI0025B602CD|nr:hypothetical protein [Rhodococcus sp. APC 3903]MDN3460805.1 hypothetical protein [Rhodococcus sp. APC 3903]
MFVPAQLPKRFVDRVLVTLLFIDCAVAAANGGGDDPFYHATARRGKWSEKDGSNFA